MKSLASLLFAIALFASPSAHAGLFEIGASGGYRRTNIDVDAYDEAISLTGSLAYYLSEASAIEVSYTDGQNKRVISDAAGNGHTTSLFYQVAGLDFIYTLGGKESFLRPYIKGGANYIISKRLVDQFRDSGGFYSPSVHEDTGQLVPSAGLGFRLGITESLSLKVGVDGSSSRPLSNPPVTIDWNGRAGLSWLF